MRINSEFINGKFSWNIDQAKCDQEFAKLLTGNLLTLNGEFLV